MMGSELTITVQDWDHGVMTHSSTKASFNYLAIMKKQSMLGTIRKEIENKPWYSRFLNSVRII